MTALVINDRRRTALIVTQLWGFFERTRSPAVAQRRTSVVGKRILSSALVKARLVSISTSVINLGGYHEGESGDGFPVGIVYNDHVTETHLDLARCGALGEYGNIW